MSEPQLVERWETAVVKAVEQFHYGDTISREWLESEFGIEWPEKMSRTEAKELSLRFMTVMHEFSTTLLINHKVALHPNHRGGWVIVDPGEQHILAAEILRKGVCKAFERANTVLENTRTDLLSDEQARERRLTQARMANLSTMASKRLKGLPTPE